MNRPLSVLHISTADNLGGAARSAYKIHRGLRDLGLRSRMLVRTKVTSDPDVALLNGGRLILRLLELGLRKIADPLGWQYLFYPTASLLGRNPWFREADVVQIYNTHGGYFSHRALATLSQRRAVVWRLSDMWALTGHCVYSYDCQRWKTGCGSCPLLRDYPTMWRDTTARLFRIKAGIYARAHLTLAVTNSWMEGLVQQSPLLQRFTAHRIPNGVDTEVFRPQPKTEARAALQIPNDAAVVLFCAQVARSGTRKGGERVHAVLERVAASGSRPWLVVLGEGAESWPESASYPIRRIGFLDQDQRLAAVYSAADVLLHPAQAENFPNTVLEAMACGVPSAAFDCGGTADAVRHLETGYLAPQNDNEALARGVTRLLSDDALRARLSAHGLGVALAEYGSQLQASRYRALYEALLQQRQPADPPAPAGLA